MTTKSRRQLPPYPPSGMAMMRLCSLLSQRGFGGGVFVSCFLGFPHSLIFPGTSQGGILHGDIHPPAHPRRYHRKNQQGRGR